MATPQLHSYNPVYMPFNGHDADADDRHRQAKTSMISMTHSLITGGVFNQQIYRLKTPIELLQEQVAHSALHNSAQRTDAPRCHPNTRVVVKAKSYRWIMRSDIQSMNTSILWLNGAAGGGKSAIAQSLAEQCYEEHLLLASFFFSRSDPSRNHTGHLIATIVCQIYQVVPLPAQESIRRAIEQDPLIWSRDIFTQFRHLVVNPLARLVHSGFFQSLQMPRVIIIDGLDECIDRLMQQMVLELTLKALTEWHLPFLFYIASRPEPEIKAVFESPQMSGIYLNIHLDMHYLPDVDINLFLTDKLEQCRNTHPFRRYIPPQWPPDGAISTLVRKSSGQFIYASVIVKYVTSPRHYPHRQLQVILNLRPTSNSPFAELDALYCQILSSVEDLPRVQRIISFGLLFPRFGVKEIETILDMEDGELPLAISDMGSLICVLPHYSPGGILQFLHASFAEYLFDPSRSKAHYVDRSESYYIFTKAFLAAIMRVDVDDLQYITMCSNILDTLPYCLSRVDLDSDLSQYTIASFSMSAVYNRVRQDGSYILVDMWLQYYLPTILKGLNDSTSTNASTIRQHILGDFDNLLSCYLNSFPKTPRFGFNVALISFMQTPRRIPRGALFKLLRLDCGNLDSDGTAGKDILASHFLKEETIMMMSDYLCTPSRSHSHAVGPETFSEAAVYCLQYLCRHGAPSRTKIPVISNRQRRIRRMWPWKWSHKPFFEEFGGPLIKPWMWLHWPWSRKNYFLQCRKCIIYAYVALDSWYIPSDHPDAPVFHWRVDSEKYWLALHYLTLFLPAAGHSDTLVEMCRTKVFASKSQDYPGKSRRAREAMREYLAKWECALY